MVTTHLLLFFFNDGSTPPPTPVVSEDSGGGYPITQPPPGRDYTAISALAIRDYGSEVRRRTRDERCPECGQQMDRDEFGLFCWDCD